jgi:2-haloacid dehalogenase
VARWSTRWGWTPVARARGDLAERFAATWRERQIDWAFRRALMGRYVDFDVVTREAFRATSALLGVDLQTAEAGLFDTYRRLPAFADAHDGLVRLAEAGHRLVAFSNGVGATLRSLLTHARLMPPLADVVSVDEVGPTSRARPCHHLVGRGGGTPTGPGSCRRMPGTCWGEVGGAPGRLGAPLGARPLGRRRIAEPDLVVGSLAELATRLPA